MLGPHLAERPRHRRHRVAAVQGDAQQFVQDRGALPGRAVAVGERGDPARRGHRRRASLRREPDRSGDGPHQRAVPGGPALGLEVQGGGEVPGQSAAEHDLGLDADVLGVARRPAAEPFEHLGQVEPAGREQRFAEVDGHLGVVGGLTRVPAAAPAHLGGAGEARPERPGRPELEGRAERVPDRRAEHRPDHPLPPSRHVRLTLRSALALR
ncbi:hypothetical protein GCM10009759_52950 [Kitasatospora saccharophila]|uniref:Uncharacterized protein n=1 Tax=Kitasatospora saccharophila TaxID=407973 RepID=A0ABN2XF75_9ACTN